MNGYNATHFDIFGIGHIPKKISKFTGNSTITTNIYRIQANDLIICGYIYIGFIDFMLKGKSLLDSPNLFSPKEYEMNDKIILKYFQQILKKLRWKRSIVLFVVCMKNLKTLKGHKFFKKQFIL